jgi:hypothetical protein
MHDPRPSRYTPQLSAYLAKCLRNDLASSEQIACLDLAMQASVSSPTAKTFALAMDEIYRRFGLLGISVQLEQLAQALTAWKTPEAESVKRTLWRWAKEIVDKESQQK